MPLDDGTTTRFFVEMSPTVSLVTTTISDEYDPATRDNATAFILAPFTDGSWLGEIGGGRAQWTDWPINPDQWNVCTSTAAVDGETVWLDADNVWVNGGIWVDSGDSWA